MSWRRGLSSQSVRPLWGLTGETRSQPGVTVAGGPRGSVPGPMMGDTPSGVVARRMWPSRVASFGRVTHAPADPRALYGASDEHYYISLGRRPGAPKWVPGWCGWRGEEAAVAVARVWSRSWASVDARVRRPHGPA